MHALVCVVNKPVQPGLLILGILMMTSKPFRHSAHALADRTVAQLPHASDRAHSSKPRWTRARSPTQTMQLGTATGRTMAMAMAEWTRPGMLADRLFCSAATKQMMTCTPKCVAAGAHICVDTYATTPDTHAILLCQGRANVRVCVRMTSVECACALRTQHRAKTPF